MVDAGADVAQISIFDEIGFYGVSASQFAEDFNAIKDKNEIIVYLNSPGGSVFDGLTIYNILSSVRDKLVIEVLGLAASAASVIALAGRELVMNSGTFLMIHNPLVATSGNAEGLRKDADVLDKIRNEILNIYTAHSNLSREELIAMMDDETWLTAEDALKHGFASSINKETKAVASLYNISNMGFSKVPKNLARPQVTIKNQSVREIEATLRDVGFSNSEATMIASKVGVEKNDERDSQNSEDIEALNQIRSLFH